MENNQEKEVLTPEVEIVQTSIVPVKSQEAGVAMLFTPERKEQLIQAFIQTEVSNYTTSPNECKKLVRESKKLVIKDRNDKEGKEKLEKKYRQFVKARTGTEAERKKIVEPYMKIKDGIDNVGKVDILGILKPEEDRMKEALDLWKQWEKEEADRIEAEAKEKLENRVKELQEVGLTFDGTFYSIGENISVDIVTIKDFSEEVFEEFKSRVSAENEKLVEAKRIQDLHDERRELALPFIAYWMDEEKSMNFGEVSESSFEDFMTRIQKAKSDFEETQKQQAEEAEKQIQERKALNYDKRSFKLEKQDFEIQSDGSVFFMNTFGRTGFSKTELEELSNEQFEELFNKKVSEKETFELELKAKEKAEKENAEAEAKKKESEKAEADEKAKINSRIEALLKLGLKFNGEDTYFLADINVAILDLKTYSDAEFNDALIGATKRKAEIEKEIAEQEEAERLQKLPEIKKAERYIEEVFKIQIPQINGAEIAEILAEFKNKIKTASEEALSNLKKLK